MKFAPLALLLLTACAAPDTDLVVTGQDMAGLPAGSVKAAIRAENEFLGTDPGGGGGTGGGHQIAVSFDQRYGRVGKIGLVRQVAVSPNLSLRGQVAAGVTATQFYLPDGLDILTDPITLTQHSQFAEVQAAAVFPQAALGDWQAAYVAGGGVAAVRTRTSVTSALLDVHSRDLALEPYAVLGLDMNRPQTGLGWTGEVRLFPNLAVEAVAGFNMRF